MMRNDGRLLRSCAIAGVAVLALASTSVRALAVDLRWGVWASNPEQSAVWQQLADLVEEEHPDISISLETAPWGPYWDKFTTQLASNSAPDIISLHHMFFANYAANDLLLDLRSLIEESADINYDDFYEGAKNGISDENGVYALAYGLAPYLLYYNKDIFDKEGIDYPDPFVPMSFEEFADLSKRFYRPEAEQFGYTSELSLMGVLPFILSNGGNYTNEAKTESEFGSDDSVGGLRVALDRFKAGGGAAPVLDLANPTGIDQFSNGNIAMMADGSWMMGVISQRGDVNWDIAPVPAGSAGSVTWSGVSGFAPSKATEHREAAWRAVKTLTSTEALEIIGSTGREFPARKSALDSWLSSEIAPDNAELIPYIFSGEGEAIAKPLKGGPGWPQIWNMTLRELGPGFLGTKDAEEIAQKIDAEINRIIQSY